MTRQPLDTHSERTNFMLALEESVKSLHDDFEVMCSKFGAVESRIERRMRQVDEQEREHEALRGLVRTLADGELEHRSTVLRQLTALHARVEALAQTPKVAGPTDKLKHWGFILMGGAAALGGKEAAVAVVEVLKLLG